MSAKSQPEDRRHQSSQDELLHRLDQLDDSLRDRIDQDHRFESGVPEHQRPTDLDFILMSGLTRPAPENVLSAADFSRPISFFEEGVVDVDDSMAPATIDSEPITDEVLGAAPIAPPVGFQGDSNIIEMPGMTPPAEVSETEVSEAQAEPEPVADDADQEPELLQPSAIPGFEEAYEEPPATAEDLHEQPGPDEAVPQALQTPPALPDKPENPAMPEPAVLADASPEISFADEIAPSDDEVSLLIDQYLKSARQEAIESVAPPAPTPPAVPDQEPVPPLVSLEPLPEVEIEPEPALAAAPTFETEAVPPPHEETRPPDLAETDLFLRALENQPRELTVEPAVADEEAAEPGQPAGPPADEVEELPVRESLTRHSPRRSRRSRSRARRHRIRLALISVAIAVAAATVTGAYLWIRPMFSTPEARFASAEQLAAAGSFSQAAAAFEAFASAYPQHPSRSSAEFLAAHFACMAPARDFDEEQAINQRALALFEKFLRDNPTHVKAPRAWTMLAQLHYKLGRYQEAVNILRDPVLRLRDPESALPGLHTLARSYVRLGEHESAVSAYQQAAAFAGNYAPDADYDELGDLFKLRADRADDVQEVQKLRQTAVENWRYAIRVPGIDPANKAKIQDKINWLESQLGEQQQLPATTETGPVAAGPVEPAPAPAADTVPPAPAVDPAAEARFLGGGPGMDSVP